MAVTTMASSSVARLVSLCMLSCCVSAGAFVPTQGRLALGHAPQRQSLPAVHVAAGAASEGESRSGVLAPMALGALLVLAGAGRKSSRSSATARRVTLEQIESLTVEDIPVDFRPKISIGMQRRYAYAQSIRDAFERSFLVMVFNADGMDFATQDQVIDFFPQNCVVRSLKNSIVKRGIQGTQWEIFSEHLKGPNTYVFCFEDTDVKATVEGYLKMEKKFKRVDKVKEIAERTAPLFNWVATSALVGAVMRDDWTFIGPDQTRKLKDLPTRLELIAKIAGSVKQVPQKLAVAINQVPTKLAVGTKKIVEKMEEGGKDSVGDVTA